MSQSLLSTQHFSVKLESHGTDIFPVADMIFDLKPGETLCLVGESGSGKSVSMQSLLGLIEGVSFHHQSSVSLGGQDLLNLSERQMQQIRGRRIAMIFQEPMSALNPVLTIGQQIIEVLLLHTQHSKKSAYLKAIHLLHSVGIQEPAARMQAYPHELSGGMKQRVVIAMALAGDPDILIADEPTTALDVTTQSQVLSLIQALQVERDMGLLLITHDLAIVAHMADRVAVMYAGQLVECAPKETFFKHPKHPYSQQLMACLPHLAIRDKPLATIPGRLPTLIEDFKACRFAPRCPHVYVRCHECAPQLIAAEGTEVRCHLYEDKHQKKPELVLNDVKFAPVPTSDEVLLSVRGLKVYFSLKSPYFWRKTRHLKAVDGLDLILNKGSILAIVGESGCGKSTLAKSLLGLIPQAMGQVEVNGRPFTCGQRDVQMVFQDPYGSLNPRMRVEDIISEGWKAHGLYTDKSERLERLCSLLTEVGMPADILDRYPHEFSGGQRQRIALARALSMDPALLILDEPTSALDVSVQAQIINLLKAIQAVKPDLSYLFISHNLSVVAYLADHIAVMYLGRIVEYGSVQELVTDPKHPYTQSLLAAIPTLENRDKPFTAIPGELPSPITPPSGCHFHPRCPRAMAQCTMSYPPEFTLTDGRKVACYLYDNSMV